MAGRNIGHVEFIVDFDGDHLPRQAREIGRRAGREMGDGLDEGSEKQLSEFGTRLRKEMDKNGRSSGKSFSDAFEDSINKNLDDTVREVSDIFTREGAFDEWAKSFDDIGDASDDLDRKLERLHETGRLTDDQFLDAIDTQSRFVTRARQASDEVKRQDDALGDLRDTLRGMEINRLDEVGKAFDELGKKTRRLSIARGEIDEFNRIFGDGSDVEIRRYADSVGTDLSGAFQRLDRRIVGVGREFPELRSQIEQARLGAARMHHELGLGDTRLERYRKRLDSFSGSVGHKAAVGLDRIADSLRRVNLGLPSFSYGFRQAVFWVGLFTALAPGIAVLGSVTGSGIVSLATGVGALGIAVAALIPGFKGMLDDVDKLPPKARGAATALQAFGAPLAEMQDVIQEGMFEGLGDDIDALRTKVLPRITDGMGKTASTINGIFERMIGRLASRRSLGRLDRIFSGLQPILGDLGDTVGNLTGAIGTIFEAALPSGQGFFDFLEKKTGEFNTWLNGTDGRDALTGWFENLGKIMPGIGDLLGASGRAISSLVTPEAITNMQTFLSTMSDSVPKVVGGLGGLIDAADPLGLAATATQKIGDWFSQNAPGMESFGKAANGFVTQVGDQLGTFLGNIGEEALKIAPETLTGIGDGLESIGKAANSEDGKAAIAATGGAVASLAGAVGDLAKALEESGAIQAALKGIGSAANLIGGGADTVDAVTEAIRGNTKESEKAAKEGKKKLDAVDIFPDWLTTPDKYAKKNYKGGGLGGFSQFIQDAIAGGAGDPKSMARATKQAQNGGFWDQLFGSLTTSLTGNSTFVKKAQERAKKAAKEGAGKVKKSAEDGVTEGFSGGGGFGDKGGAGVKGNPKVVGAATGLFSGFIEAFKAAPTALKVGGGVLGGLIDNLFSGDDGKTKAKSKGKETKGSFVEGLRGAVDGVTGWFDDVFGGDDGKSKAKGKGKEAKSSFVEGLSSAAGKVGEWFGDVFGGDDGKTKAKGKGKEAKSSFVEGLGTALGGAADWFGDLFTGDNGKGKAKEAGSAAKGAYVEGIKGGAAAGGLGGGIADALGSLFPPTAGSSAASTAGLNSGLAYTSSITSGVYQGGGSINLASQAATNQLVAPFDGVPGRVGVAVGGVPGAVGGVMGSVTGQPGADNVANPFAAVPGRITGQIAGTPGAVGGVMGQVTGQPGADRTVSPFGGVTNRITGQIAGTPGAVGGVMGAIDGSPGANNIVTPFGGVPGRVRGQVGGTPGAVQGALGGISDFGAAARIVAPFTGVPGLIRSALSGIGSIVSGALSGARAALSVGLGAIRAAASNAHASGTITSGPEVALIGEAGPEAVVPLNRPLSRVDPRVRGISAILQGKADLPTGGRGYGTYVAEGAIQVVAPNSDPRLVAAATVDRMVAAAIR